MNSSQVEFDYSLLSNKVEAFCSLNLDHPICLSIKLEGKITFDDVDYVVQIPFNNTTAVIIGSYIPAVFTAIGVIGNLACLATMAWLRKTEDVYVYINFLAALNIMYLCTASISQELGAAGYTPIIHKHYIACMLWPSVVELLCNVISWTVAVLAVHLSHSQMKSLSVHIFLARVKCLVALIIMVFLNFHTTLLRELNNEQCKVSAKAGTFYRNIWPWMRISCCTYLPWAVAAAAMVKNCGMRILHVSNRADNIPVRKISLLCWFYIIAIVPRVILYLHQYLLMKTNEEDNFKYSPRVVNIQLTRELYTTAVHSLAFIPILWATIDRRSCSRPSIDHV